MARSITSLWLVALGSIGTINVAWAGGSIALSELRQLIQTSSPLTAQINAEASRAGTPTDQITCDAERLGNRVWPKLGGTRVGPYRCTIGNRILKITTEQTYFDKTGKKLKMNQAGVQTNAVKVQENNVSWTWCDATDDAACSQ